MPLEFPSLPGAYALFLTLAEETELPVGRRGVFVFPAGRYVYLGSARGPGGLQARLRHHLSAVRRPHWHIDWLRAQAVVTGGCYLVQEVQAAESLPLECVWSQAILDLPGATVPVKRFGDSDCRSGCPAHLIYLAEAEDLVARLREVTDGEVLVWEMYNEIQ